MDPELALRIGPLGTTLEGELDDVLHAVARAHRAVVSSRLNRPVLCTPLRSRRCEHPAPSSVTGPWG
jgi:uncharacterized protein YqgV (UPF0045/DUF77 family)